MQQTSNMNLIVVAHSFMLLQQTVVALPVAKHVFYTRFTTLICTSVFSLVFMYITSLGMYRKTSQQQLQFSFILAS